LLQSESPSGMCAKLHTVAASNNRVHPTRSLSSSPLANTINCSLASQALWEVTHQDHSIGTTLLLFVQATYIWCCSSGTFRSWWTTHSAQRQRKGYNTINDIINTKWARQNLGTKWNVKPICHVRCLQQSLGFNDYPKTVASFPQSRIMANKLFCFSLCLTLKLRWGADINN